VIGLLTDVSRVVEKHIADKIRYLDPAEVTNKYADYLRNEKKCDLVMCLSHLGYDGSHDSDVELARRIRNVDLIIGGHSHTFLESSVQVEDLDGRPVTVVTDGCWGLYIGNLKVDVK
jgi:5'-nucleotidase